MYYEKQTKATNKFIVYSSYGLQSHIIMNNNGVMFSCNPKHDDSYSAIVYNSVDEALVAKDKFYDKVAEVQLITKYEKDYQNEEED